jgi:hypothetical protein
VKQAEPIPYWVVLFEATLTPEMIRAYPKDRRAAMKRFGSVAAVTYEDYDEAQTDAQEYVEGSIVNRFKGEQRRTTISGPYYRRGW